MRARVAHAQVHVLGEGPTWDTGDQVARWVDIQRGTLHEGRLQEGALETSVLHRREPALAAAVHTTEGGFLLATSTSLVHLDAAGAERTVARLVPEGVRSRLNDGAADPAGRYLAGSMALDDRTGQERLWRLEHDGRVTVLDDDLTLSNGLGWSPDGGVLYSTDTSAGRVWARDYDPDTGRTGPRRPCLDLGEESPDGLTVDAAGSLWVAVYSAGEVRCHAPDGRLLEVVEVGALPATSCAFVGPTLETLLVTTASEEQEHPDAGKLFTVEPGVVGLPTVPWTPVRT